MSVTLLHRVAPAALLLLFTACADVAAPNLPVSDGSPSLATSTGSGPGGVNQGLAVWLRADAGIGASDGARVVRWRDQSGNRRDGIWDDHNSYGELPPAFRASNSAVRLRPSVRFDGQQALDLDLGFLAGSDYTVIAVNGRDRAGFANFWLAGDRATINESLILGYERTDLLRQSHFGNDLDAVVEDYTGTEVWSLDTYTLDQSTGRAMFHNGAPSGVDNSLSAVTSTSGANLGHFRAISSYWFQGDLSEVIVFNRAITPAERLRIETQLAQRYGFAPRLEDYVPCAGPWTSHDEYVSAHWRAVRNFVDADLLTQGQGQAAQAAAVASECGE